MSEILMEIAGVSVIVLLIVVLTPFTALAFEEYGEAPELAKAEKLPLHKDYVSEKELEKKVKESEYDNWAALFNVAGLLKFSISQDVGNMDLSIEKTQQREIEVMVKSVYTKDKTAKEIFVKNGKPVAVIGSGTEDMRTASDALVIPGGLEGDFGDAPLWKIRGYSSLGWGNTIEGELAIWWNSDFHIHARLALPEISETGASFIMGGGYHTSFAVPEGRHALRIWLDGADGKMYVRDYPMSVKECGVFPGRPFNLEVVTERYPHIRTAGRLPVGTVSDYITAGKPFDLDLVRSGGEVTLRIDGKEVFRSTLNIAKKARLKAENISVSASRLELRRWPANFGFLADRGTIRLEEFWAEGRFARPEVEHVDLWMLGGEGYNSYRTPALCVTNEGTLLAFAAARCVGASASGVHDLVMKRSTDGGRTWSQTRVIWDTGDERFYMRDPTLVVDRDTGEVFLLAGSNVARPGTDEPPRDRLGVFLMSSKDDGLSWSDPRPLERINDKLSHLTAGCSHGIQLRRAPHEGRLVIPGWTKVKIEGSIRSAVIYSDDHGRTWALGGTVPVWSSADEPTVVELADGSILMTGRGRGVFTSKDGGESFDPVDWEWDSEVGRTNPSFMRYSWPGDGEGNGQDRILYCDIGAAHRRSLTVRMSYDGCRTWPVSRVIYRGGSGYSDMIVLPDGRIGVLYEKDDYRRISFVIISLDFLTAKTMQRES